MLSKYSNNLFLKKIYNHKPHSLFLPSHIIIPSIILLRSRDLQFFEAMKFGKRLKQHIQDSIPGWKDKFLSYKDLKKLLKLISSAQTTAAAAPLLNLNGSMVEYGKAESEFVYLLNNEIEKFNTFFVEQEEDFIIRHKVCLIYLVSLFLRSIEFFFFFFFIVFFFFWCC